jgi:hypothetical protein
VAVKLRFTKAGRKALRNARRAKLALALSFQPAQGSAVTGGAVVTLKR